LLGGDGQSLRHRQIIRTAAALFGAASVITLISIFAPHQPQHETEGPAFVAAGSVLVTAVLLLGGERLPGWTAHVWPAAGNRRAVGERFANELARARRNGETFAALVIDVDQFKQVNDRDGHAAGDEALVDLARMLSSELREIDSVARIGGDEFAVLLPGTGVNGVRATAERLRDRAGIPISIGAAVYGIDGHTADEPARAADAALYDAKLRRVEPQASGAR
jgi:diguanylate cyclase (GGDEF)-like protein